ncbi:MAG: OprD family outer membrane porin [Verrucomicrobiota bacterium]
MNQQSSLTGTTACLLVLLVISLVGSLQAADSPEYLKVEGPVVVSLKEERSPTDSIGTSPKSWITERRSFKLLPNQVLPRLWDQYMPLTGTPFFDGIDFLVSPRFYYFRRDTENVGIAESAAMGGALEMETGWWQDILRLKLTGYTSQKLYGPVDRDGSSSLRTGQESYTVLGEAVAEIKVGVLKARAGRTRIDLPYINAYDIRMTPNTFEGVGFSIHSLRNLQLAAGHLSKIKLRNRSSFESMSQRAGVDGADRGVSFVGLRYNFSEDSHIGAVNQYGWDMFNTFYVEVDRLFEWQDDFSVRLGAQFTDQRSTGDELLGGFSTQVGGVKLALGVRELVASAAFVVTSRGGDVRNPWGGSPTFRSSLISDQDRAGERAVKLGATYGFDHWGFKGLAADVGYLHVITPDTGSAASPDEEEYSATLDYQIPGKRFDNIWLRIRYAFNNQDSARGGNDREDFRIILNYAYAF